ncbi:ribonuclease HI [Candidatus Saccharibacteria bacterium]|nr:ribonuclease HI [Candidatus Saccharibacteria bacterium]
MTKTLWTDGSASPNPGPGGFAVLENGKPVRLGREKDSSNIRMEGAALIAAMEYAGEEGCEIFTDSQFWKSVLEQWAKSWESRGWKKKTGEIKNLEMVKEIWKLYNRYPVEIKWVRGHVGTEMNELADEWANRARKGEKVEGESEILKGILRAEA